MEFLYLPMIAKVKYVFITGINTISLNWLIYTFVHCYLYCCIHLCMNVYIYVYMHMCVSQKTYIKHPSSLYLSFHTQQRKPCLCSIQHLKRNPLWFAQGSGFSEQSLWYDFKTTTKLVRFLGVFWSFYSFKSWFNYGV